MNNMSFGEFMVVGCLAYGIFLLSDILASFTVKFIGKFKNKINGRDNNEGK